MGLGIPAVCSTVGVNRDIIHHDENGILAGSDEEWVTALLALMRDPARRSRLGQAGRATVERGYSAAVTAPRVQAIFGAAAGGRPADMTMTKGASV